MINFPQKKSTNVIQAGKVLGYAQGFGLENGLEAKDCEAANCMGIHVHEGMSCVDSDSQGGHYFAGDGDPWATAVYNQTTGNGTTFPLYAQFGVDIGIDTTDLRKRAFIMHDFSGGRVACGLLVMTGEPPNNKKEPESSSDEGEHKPTCLNSYCSSLIDCSGCSACYGGICRSSEEMDMLKKNKMKNKIKNEMIKKELPSE